MRDLLEELPHALLPDPARESEDPGVERVVQDDDLVRPAAEEDLAIDAHRSRRSPLARHVDLVIDPFDPRLPTPIGLSLAVEGQRVRSASLEPGMTHQGIERRAVGIAVDDVALAALVAMVDPPPLHALGVAVAVERMAGASVGPATTRWRAVLVDLIACASHARALADVLRRHPRLAARAGAIVTAADAARDGLDIDHRFACPGRLRHPVPEDERATLARRLDDLQRAAAALPPDLVEDALASLRGAGVLEAARCRELGIDGPALAATGETTTLPADLGRALGRRVVDEGGCALARSLTRAAEIEAAVQRLAALDTGAGDDEDGAVVDCRALDGVGSALVRGPTGTSAIHLVLRAGVVQRLRLRTPDLPLLPGLMRALRGVRLDDVTEVLASFGVRASAIDR
jgi:Ni,Fe-hydrogenase III large subunit